MNRGSCRPIVLRSQSSMTLLTVLSLFLVNVPTFAEDAKTEAKTEAASVAGDAVQQQAQQPLPWALRPYVVEVSISFADSPELTPALQQEWCHELNQLLTARYGKMWELQVRCAAVWQSVATLNTLENAAASVYWQSSAADKVFRLLCSTNPQRQFVLSGREWDPSSQTLSNMQQRTTAELREIPASAAELISDLFRPLVEIGTIDGRRMEGILRAGEYPVRPADDQPITVGSYFVPFLRFQNKNKQLQRTQMIPWTYLEVQQIDRARAELKMSSAFRSPLPTSRRRVEVLAMLVRQQWDSTDVLVYPRGNRLNSLVGVRCTLGPQDVPAAVSNDEHESPAVKPLELATDRRGIVTLPATPKQKLQSLQIFSGTALLARVPVLPGSAPLLELETPDDRARLTIEGEVQLLEGELTEIVATREVLITRTNAAMDQKRWGDVDRFVNDLARLPTQKQFIDRIDKLQLQAVQAAKANRDQVAVTRIERLCTGIRETAEKYLEPTRVSEFLLQVNSQRNKQAAEK